MTAPLPNDDPPSTERSRSACGACAWWRLPLLLALVLGAVVALNGRGIRVGEDAPGPVGVAPAADGKPSGEKVSLEIDFGDEGERKAYAVAWREGLTVADALTAVRGRTNDASPVTFAVQGSGPSAFLTALGGVANEGAGGANWTYSVNGQRADRSFAVYELQPGDQVLWSFAGSE